MNVPKLKIFYGLLILAGINILLSSLLLLVLSDYSSSFMYDIVHLNDLQRFLLTLWLTLQLFHLEAYPILLFCFLWVGLREAHKIIVDFSDNAITTESPLFRINIIGITLSVTRYIIAFLLSLFVLDIIGFILSYNTLAQFYDNHRILNLLTHMPLKNLILASVVTCAYLYLSLRLKYEWLVYRIIIHEI